MDYLTLNTGAKIPAVGFGVFQIPDAEECKRVVLDAIKVGYRSFDTAASSAPSASRISSRMYSPTSARR